MIILTIALLLFIYGIYLGVTDYPLLGFLVCVISGMIPLIYDPFIKLMKKWGL